MIVLIGFMGAGKSTVGRLLASRLRVPFADSDLVIEQRAGRPIAELFATDGEAAFRALERDVVLQLLAGPDVVLALGGGAVQDPVTRAAVAARTAVHLEVGEPEVRSRIGADPRRPLLAGSDLALLLRQRRPHYEEAARLRVVTDGRPAAVVAEEILAALARGDAGPSAG
jgi:shikimate kinase